MSRVKASSEKDIRSFFSDELRTVMSRRNVSVQNDAFEYLVTLLTNFTSSENFFHKTSDGRLEDNVLAKIYARSLRSSPEEKKVNLKRLGDVCLMVAGMFPESLRRKLIDVNYYVGMGGAAYGTLSHMQISKMTRALFDELSIKFSDFTMLIGELSERGGVQTNSDLLALYERWILTGDERLRRSLSERGISIPVVVNTKSNN